MLFFTNNTERNPLIIFPNKIIKKVKKYVFVKVIFVSYHSVFRWPVFDIRAILIFLEIPFVAKILRRKKNNNIYIYFFRNNNI